MGLDFLVVPRPIYWLHSHAVVHLLNGKTKTTLEM